MTSPEYWPAPMRNAIRSSNKYVLNPLMKRLAGRKHWYAGIIRHTGRTSGKQYSTPIVANPVDGGFVIPLPYGTEVDWLRNVLASNRATIVDHGQVSEVSNPQVIDATTALPMLEPRWQRTYERAGVRKYLRVINEAVT